MTRILSCFVLLFATSSYSRAATVVITNDAPDVEITFTAYNTVTGQYGSVTLQYGQAIQVNNATAISFKGRINGDEPKAYGLYWDGYYFFRRTSYGRRIDLYSGR